MRRTEREITDWSRIISILRDAQYAVLSMCRDNEPYVVTLNCGYDEGRNALYFHAAPQGLKIDFITYNPRVCGTVIQDRGYLQGECAHAYRTAVFWGEMHVVGELDEKKHGMQVLLDQLEDDPDEVRRQQLQGDEAYERVAILRLDIGEISGKQGH
jgi:nitroimidazol reductase NimA-like FMN-containing flavoprotein (pyridoxamine 5'-phosphate oxidase superfamily)